MKIDAHVTVISEGCNVDIIVPIDADYVNADVDEIVDYIINSDKIYEALGRTPSVDEVEVKNMDEILEDIKFDEFEDKTTI